MSLHLEFLMRNEGCNIIRVSALQFGGESEGDMRRGQETVTYRKRRLSYRAADSYKTYRELLCTVCTWSVCKDCNCDHYCKYRPLHRTR